jgi:uncharacterized membrane protein YphA (DoxX/SURF4 family)
MATIQGTTGWGVLLLLRVVVSLPLLFFGVLHLVSPHGLRAILVAAGLPLVDLHSLLVPLVEVLAGVLLLVGILTRLGAVLAFAVMVPAVLATLQVTDGSEGPAVPTLALPVTLAVASFFLALLGGGAGSIDERMLYRRAISRASSQTATGPRGYFPWSASDTVAIVLGLLILAIARLLPLVRLRHRRHRPGSADPGHPHVFHLGTAHAVRTVPCRCPGRLHPGPRAASKKAVSAYRIGSQAQRYKGIVAGVPASDSNKENNRCL